MKVENFFSKKSKKISLYLQLHQAQHLNQGRLSQQICFFSHDVARLVCILSSLQSNVTGHVYFWKMTAIFVED